MTEYWSGSITFTGLGSSTDFDSIIEATMEVENFRLNHLKNWETQWESKLSLIQELNTQLASYKTTLKSMDSMSEFLVKSAASSNTAVLSVTADSEALEGTHEIEINQLAQNDILTTSSGWSSADDVVATVDATFSVTYGGETLEIEVPAGTTLQNLVNRINKDSGMGGNVRASLIDDGESCHLQLRGIDLGAEHTLTILDSGMDGLDAADFQRTQNAQNAQIKIDGYPPADDEWIERDSNSISDVVQGLTINLYKSDPGEPVTITVGTDTSAIIENIEKFITQSNAIRSLIQSLDDYESSDSSSEEDDSETTTFTGVHGNYGVDIVEQTLQSTLASRGVGFTYYDQETGFGDMYASLVSIGISTEVDEDSESFGMLTIDYEALEEALEEDADGVASLFAAEDDGVCNSSDMIFESVVSGVTEPGEYTINYTVSGGAVTSATINGNEAKIDGMYIVGNQGNPESGLAVEVTNVTDGVYSGTVCVRQGKINELLGILDGITDPYSGTLSIIESSYEEILANNETAMLNEEARLDDLEQRLIEKYARLEALLGEYEDINTAIESQISSLSN